MDKKTLIHQEILNSLKAYLEETPPHIIEKEIQTISELSFEGSSAKDYFENFHKYYARIEEEEKFSNSKDNAA